MKVGIRFGDNDFTTYTKAFMEMFIVPTFVEREPGHFVTHLTSSMIVELFNTHVPYVHRFMSWYYDTHHKYFYPHEKAHANVHELMLHKDWLQITETDVYWDGHLDWMLQQNGMFDHDFVWTEGLQVHIA